jgi:hypothetical protein
MLMSTPNGISVEDEILRLVVLQYIYMAAYRELGTVHIDREESVPLTRFDGVVARGAWHCWCNLLLRQKESPVGNQQAPLP